MPAVRVEIRQYVDDAQPGWVECRLIDAHGRGWSFVEKVPVVTAENLDAGSTYPRQGVVACRVLERRVEADEREIVVIDTEQPWGVEATTGETRFLVRPQQLVDLDQERSPREG
jgi:hypothetical protein